jgi:para-aminobenzoate synthetase/4-amino-4-deoxychorismate lyase
MLTSAVPDSEHADRIAAVRALIEAGDVYQVNLTVPFSTTLDHPRLAVYERMRLAQGGRYAAYLDIGEAQILSASPELFFERRGEVVRSRPMKGTVRRGLHVAADHAARDALRASEKERAENVMIVDVVRNDLGRVARTGSVRVTALCEAERYPGVWQLTSTVEADVDRALSLSELFRALFPPASITGAPKIRASRIIAAGRRSTRRVLRRHRDDQARRRRDVQRRHPHGDGVRRRAASQCRRWSDDRLDHRGRAHGGT